MFCAMVIDHCDYNQNGAVDPCEGMACLAEHADDFGCVAFCDCHGHEHTDYCMIGDYCMNYYEWEKDEGHEDYYCSCYGE